MTSAHPSVYQLPDQKQPSGPPASRQCLAAEGSHRGGHQHDFPRVQQPVVLGPKEDRKSAACNRSILSQPPHDSATLEDGDARVCPFSHQKSEVDDIDRHPRCLPSCSDAPGCQQVSTRCGQPASVPVHWSPLWVSEFSTRVHQAAAACRSAVKAARCDLDLDGWLIRADTPEQAKLHAQTTISVLQFLGWIINYEKSDLVPSQDFSSPSGCSSTLDNSQWCPNQRCVARSSPFISTGLPTWTSQPGICTGFSECWCSWLRWYDGEDFVFARSSGGPPQHGARGPGAGPTGSKFLSGFCQRWPGGHLQQSCKVYPLPSRRRKCLSSGMRPVWAGEPS